MTHQQAKKIIRGMVTLEVYEKNRELWDARQRAINGTLDEYIATAVAYAEFEADWVWRIVQATGVHAYDARRYWEAVLGSVWLESRETK
jgi:hypothetical protein